MNTTAGMIPANNPEIRKKLIGNFGNEIYLLNGEINKQKLSSIIFNNKNALTKVNSIIHPIVKKHFNNWLKENKEEKYIIKEAAILFESGANKELDIIVTVFAPENIRIERVMQRDKILKEIVLQKIKNQLNEEEKIKLSNYVIYNDSKEFLIPQILKLDTVLKKMSE